MSVRLTCKYLSRILERTLTFSRQRLLHQNQVSTTTGPTGTSYFERSFSRHTQCKNEEKVKVERPRAQTTIDEEEITKFASLSEQWWDEKGEFEALHKMNKLRVPLVSDTLQKQREKRGDTDYKQHSPLKGLKIGDIGCGGGILSEALGRLGAFVIGVDAGEENIKTAQAHLLTNSDKLINNVKYICSTVEDLVLTEERSFDAIVASEVIEHVADRKLFLKSCCQLVKPGGSIFVTTINKTRLSYLLGIVGAERVLNIVPRGTHDWNKFVSPEEIQYLLEQNGFTTRLQHGMFYNPVLKKWSWIKDTSVSYAIHAICTEEALEVN